MTLSIYCLVAGFYCTYEGGWGRGSINSNLFRILNLKQNPDKFYNIFLKLRLITFKLMPIETSLWRHNYQHATSRNVSNDTIVVKHFSYVISSEMKIFARCKKHVLYFSSVYLYLIETDLYTISFASKLLKRYEFFVIFDILMNVRIDVHISDRHKSIVKCICLLSFIKPRVPLVQCMDLYWNIKSNCKIPSFSEQNVFLTFNVVYLYIYFIS